MFDVKGSSKLDLGGKKICNESICFLFQNFASLVPSYKKNKGKMLSTFLFKASVPIAGY